MLRSILVTLLVIAVAVTAGVATFVLLNPVQTASVADTVDLTNNDNVVGEVASGMTDSNEEQEEPELPEEPFFEGFRVEFVNGEMVEIDKSNSVTISPFSRPLTFIGFGPLKSYEGIFRNMTLDVTLVEGNFFSGRLVADTNSIDTGVALLNTQLRTAGFLDTVNHPELIFNIESVSNNEAAGKLTFRGIEQQVTIPATVTDTSFEATFVFDLAPLGVNLPGMNKEIQVSSHISWE